MLLAAGILGMASFAFAQDVNEALDFEDLGFNSRLFSAARPAGLAGAYTTAGDDVHTLVYNPAGLSRVRRIEASVGFQYERNNVRNVFYGSTASVDHTSTNLDYASIAYPFPTYRGSLVGAFGVYREYSAYLDLINRGFNTATQTQDDFVLQQSGSIFSYNVGFGVDLSPTLSTGASFFILDGTVNALTQWSYQVIGPLNQGDIREHFLLDDLQVDVDGYGGRLGIQFSPHNKFRFGAALTTPIWINLEGDAFTEELLYLEDDPDEMYTDVALIDIDYRLPYRIDAGVSFTPEYFLISVDAGYADWTQSSINRTRLRDDNLEPVQREVVDVRAGVEVNIPGRPFRIRAGYAYVPYPLHYLQADRIEGAAITKASIDTERQLLAFGFGGLVGRVLTLDAAYQYIMGERSISTLKDDRALHRFLLSGSYRF